MLPHPARMCKHMRWGLMQRFPSRRVCDWPGWVEHCRLPAAKRRDTGSRVPFFCFLLLGKQEKEVASRATSGQQNLKQQSASNQHLRLIQQAPPAHLPEKNFAACARNATPGAAPPASVPAESAPEFAPARSGATATGGWSPTWFCRPQRQ